MKLLTILLSLTAAAQPSFVNEGIMADVFSPGRYKLTTQTLPLLTNLMNWDKLFDSPFKSDVYFFSTRQQIDQRWGTSQPVSIRDKDFGAVRIRAFGNYAYRIKDAKVFHSQISGTRERYTAAELDGQLRPARQGRRSDMSQRRHQRLSQIQALMGQISATNDQKSIQEIQARIGAEGTLLSHEMSQLQMLQGMADSEERIERSRDRERQYEMLNRRGKVSTYLH